MADDEAISVWRDRAAREAANLPEPGSGTGRPCYIAHDPDYPETECDGLHGAGAIAAFYAAETMPRDPGRLRQATDIERVPMDTRSNRKPMSPWNALGVLAVLMVMILAFALGIGAIIKWVW